MPDIALPLLSRVEIASPCPAKWAEMTGDSVTRHCAQCDCNVHNISAMTTADAEAFLQARVGVHRTCIRLFRRTDGTILTQDCPVGLALWRKRARFAAGRVAAALLFLVTGGFIASARQRDAFASRLRSSEPFQSVCAWFNPKATAPPVPPVPPVPPGLLGRWMAGLPSHFYPNQIPPPVQTSPTPPQDGPFPSAPTELDAPQ